MPKEKIKDALVGLDAISHISGITTDKLYPFALYVKGTNIHSMLIKKEKLSYANIRDEFLARLSGVPDVSGVPQRDNCYIGKASKSGTSWSLHLDFDFHENVYKKDKITESMMTDLAAYLGTTKEKISFQTPSEESTSAPLPSMESPEIIQLKAVFSTLAGPTKRAIRVSTEAGASREDELMGLVRATRKALIEGHVKLAQQEMNKLRSLIQEIVPADTEQTSQQIDYRSTLLGWARAKDKLRNDLRDLKDYIDNENAAEQNSNGNLDFDDDKVYEFDLDSALSKLNLIMDNFNEGLTDTLDNAMNLEDPTEKEPHHRKALDIIDSYIDKLLTSELIEHIESNPYREISVTEPLLSTLEALETQLKALTS